MTPGTTIYPELTNLFGDPRAYRVRGTLIALRRDQAGSVTGLTATILWFALVKRVGAVRASTFHFMNPFFGVTISAMLLGEAISGTDIAGVLIAMAGILAVQMSRLRAA